MRTCDTPILKKSVNPEHIVTSVRVYSDEY